MQKGFLAGLSPFAQLIMLAIIMLASYLFFMLIGILFSPFIMDIPMAELMNILNSGGMSQNLNLMRYMQTLQGVGLFIIPAFFAAYLFSGNIVKYLYLRQSLETPMEKPARWFGAVLLLMFAAMPCINLLAALNEMIVFPQSLSGLEQRLKAFEEAAQQMIKLFLEVDNVGGMFFNIFMIAMLPAIGEELIFRGLIQKNIARWTRNIHVAIIITGFIFAAVHLQFYGLFPRWLLGVMFGYLLVWSGTMWLPVFAHFVNNAMAVFLSYLIHKEIIPEKIEIFGATKSDIPVTMVAAIICAWLLWKMYRIRVEGK